MAQVKPDFMRATVAIACNKVLAYVFEGLALCVGSKTMTKPQPEVTRRPAYYGQ